ncbi:MAG: hypothetical protein QXH55_02930 [Candidatus Korarchaeota archaeon]|nr:hypothetical protein [Thermoproteota archaeon]MCR8463121.1 hypothetical protein [Thermoproteota archaeon]MCR8470999.1 hypothetical protein [Thermoproteota archaeon]MCR8472386.1 hypothetical protein [Thermoproteota archaeon]MCR8473431.1 hypothetical protein [Thermoproteota archaeon]
MNDFMALLYSKLPEEYKVLAERFDSESFAELMRRVMSLKFKMRPLPKRMWVKNNGRAILAGSKILKTADDLAERILACIKEYGVQPELIIEKLVKIQSQ